MTQRRWAALAVIALTGLAAACSDGSESAGTTANDTAVAASTSLVPQTTVDLSTDTTVAELPTRPGAITLHLKAGPFTIQPGQNNIDNMLAIPQPDVSGWIVGFRPDLTYLDGTVPRVDVVHLHHGVWLNLTRPDATSGLPERFFASGEEKTITALPAP